MGKKRKYDEMDEEKLIQKIQKLQNKLKNKQNQGDRLPLNSSRSPCSPDDIDVTLNDDHESIYMPPSEWAGTVTPGREQSFLQESHQFEAEDQQDTSWSPRPGPSALAEPATPPDKSLDEAILSILGDAPTPESFFGNNIHKDVAARWQQILEKGLTKELREKLVCDYLIPANCDLLVPPILNPEVKAALPETLVKRDFSLLNKQKQVSAALAALAQVTDMVISNQFTKEKLLKPLSDACRLLCDSYNKETYTRRSFVIASINSNLKGALIDTKRDKFLFGENLTEKLNTAKTIQKSGDTLKNQDRANRNHNNNRNQPRGKLNTRALHPRQAANRFDAGQFRPAAYRPPPHRAHGPRPPAPRRARSPPPPVLPHKTHQPYRR